MALIRCQGCMNGVSTNARVCPMCGAPPREPADIGAIVFYVVGALVAFFAVGTFLAAKSAIHEILAGIAVLVFIVCFSAGTILTHLRRQSRLIAYGNFLSSANATAARCSDAEEELKCAECGIVAKVSAFNRLAVGMGTVCPNCGCR